MKPTSKLLAAILVITIASCFEAKPKINFGDGLSVLKDTTFVLDNLNITPQDKGILIEDLGGVNCANCPTAARRAQEIKDDYPKRVVVAALYPNVMPFAYRLNPKDTLDTPEATDVFLEIYGGGGLPAGSVNRKRFPGQTAFTSLSSKWRNLTEQELPLKSRINIEAATVKENESIYVLNVKFTASETVDNKLFISIMLLEDGINTTQADGSIKDPNYIHNHVLRKMYTAYDGDLLYDSPEKGRVIERRIEIPIPQNVDPSKASIVVFVNENTAESREVLNVKEIKLN